ncbi:hypothetical protein NUSPORA_00746 [Nucleospora cyclopteri]
MFKIKYANIFMHQKKWKYRRTVYIVVFIIIFTLFFYYLDFYNIFAFKSKSSKHILDPNKKVPKPLGSTSCSDETSSRSELKRYLKEQKRLDELKRRNYLQFTNEILEGDADDENESSEEEIISEQQFLQKAPSIQSFKKKKKELISKTTSNLLSQSRGDTILKKLYIKKFQKLNRKKNHKVILNCINKLNKFIKIKRKFIYKSFEKKILIIRSLLTKEINEMNEQKEGSEFSNSIKQYFTAYTKTANYITSLINENNSTITFENCLKIIETLEKMLTLEQDILISNEEPRTPLNNNLTIITMQRTPSSILKTQDTPRKTKNLRVSFSNIQKTTSESES